MIIFPAEHYFECALPKLEPDEEIIWFQHPVFDLKCNQLGMIFPGEDSKITNYNSRKKDRYKKDVIKNDKRTAMTIGYADRLVYECYTKKILGRCDKVYYRDGNPSHLYYGNVLSSLDKHEPLNKISRKMKEFRYKTREIFLQKEKKLRQRGIDPAVYWEILSIPAWVYSEYGQRKHKKNTNED